VDAAQDLPAAAIFALRMNRPSPLAGEAISAVGRWEIGVAKVR